MILKGRQKNIEHRTQNTQKMAKVICEQLSCTKCWNMCNCAFINRLQYLYCHNGVIICQTFLRGHCFQVLRYGQSGAKDVLQVQFSYQYQSSPVLVVNIFKYQNYFLRSCQQPGTQTHFHQPRRLLRKVRITTLWKQVQYRMVQGWFLGQYITSD